MSVKLSLSSESFDSNLNILVIGVGGAGGNAVNYMISSGLMGVRFLVANSDAQALALSKSKNQIQLGVNITHGLGAGANPDIGEAAARDSLEEIILNISDADMVIIVAGLGGGTGSGAAPVIAKAARQNNILTIGAVTKPFQFEGAKRMKNAESALVELQRFVDTLLVIPNQNLFRVANSNTTFAEAFKMADEALYLGVRSLTDLLAVPGLINLEFNDFRTVIGQSGKAMIGTGEAKGIRRATEAAEQAINNPLLDDASIRSATGLLINIAAGSDITLFEVDEAANRVRAEVGNDVNIIFGSTFDEALEGRVRVSVVATGIGNIKSKESDQSLFDSEDIIIPEQGEGPSYCVGTECRIELAPAVPLSDQDDKITLKELHPELVLAVNDLVKSLISSNAHRDLLELVQRYQNEVEMPVEKIRFSVLTARGIRLQNSIFAIAQNVQDNLEPSLKNSQMEALNSVVSLNGPFILASEQGREFVEAANRYNMTAGDEKIYKKYVDRLVEKLAESTDIATPETTEFLESVNKDLGQGKYPERSGLMARRTNQNFLSIIGRISISTGQMGMAGLFGAVASESVLGQSIIQDAVSLINSTSNFVIENDNIFLGLAGASQESLGWILSLVNKLKMEGEVKNK